MPVAYPGGVGVGGWGVGEGRGYKPRSEFVLVVSLKIPTDLHFRGP